MGPGGESHLAGAHCGARYRATRCGCNANICARSVSGHLLGKKVNQNDSCLFLNKLRLKFAFSVHIRVERGIWSYIMHGDLRMSKGKVLL